MKTCNFGKGLSRKDAPKRPQKVPIYMNQPSVHAHSGCAMLLHACRLLVPCKRPLRVTRGPSCTLSAQDAFAGLLTSLQLLKCLGYDRNPPLLHAWRLRGLGRIAPVSFTRSVNDVCADAQRSQLATPASPQGVMRCPTPNHALRCFSVLAEAPRARTPSPPAAGLMAAQLRGGTTNHHYRDMRCCIARWGVILHVFQEQPLLGQAPTAAPVCPETEQTTVSHVGLPHEASASCFPAGTNHCAVEFI